MRLVILFVFCLLPLRQGLFPSVEKPRPKFSDYPVKKIYRGKPARPVITKEWHFYRTMIRRGADYEVEFAGHYTIPRWGCGTNCNVFVIVDSISGRVYDGLGLDGLPYDWVKSHGGQRDRANGVSSQQPLDEDKCLSE